MRPRIAASPGQHPNRSTACLTTLHEPWGSKYPCVVVRLTTSAWIILRRNLLYTPGTRARKLVVLVGSTRAPRSGRARHRLQAPPHRRASAKSVTYGLT